MCLVKLLIIVAIFLCNLVLIDCSIGDQSPFFNRCTSRCDENNCKENNATLQELRPLEYLEYLFSYTFPYLWTCREDCEYDCQWKTVEAFIKRGWDVPQFKGKWPFVRFMGIQEPASFYFSLLNFLANLKFYYRFKKVVNKNSPLYALWNIHAWVNLNNWTWSSIFHAKDTKFTEMMDYGCAFFMVLFSLYAMGLRVLYDLTSRYKLYSYIWTVLNVVVFSNHVYYMFYINFDYGFNMKVNIRVGTITLVGWLTWFFSRRKQQPHVWKIALFAILIALSTLLEVLDFPPLLWTFDAHSLWHLSTAFIIYFFYSYIIDDCIYLYNLENKAKIHQE